MSAPIRSGPGSAIQIRSGGDFTSGCVARLPDAWERKQIVKVHHYQCGQRRPAGNRKAASIKMWWRVASNLGRLFNYETKKRRRFIRQKSPASTTGEQHIGSLDAPDA
jgi:hypothetical protein